MPLKCKHNVSFRGPYLPSLEMFVYSYTNILWVYIMELWYHLRSCPSKFHLKFHHLKYVKKGRRYRYRITTQILEYLRPAEAESVLRCKLMMYFTLLVYDKSQSFYLLQDITWKNLSPFLPSLHSLVFLLFEVTSFFTIVPTRWTTIPSQEIENEPRTKW